ncbi:MAG: ABC transporter permease subunit [Chloroflexota bacterium]|nr:ABC transporter permease subunit [Chloroflexota bacterium]MDE2945867.1 ABC transporter permease subunit [Chloroflexota bacterium]
MIGSVFIETLKTTWKQMVYWGVGLSAMAILVVIMVPLFNMQDMRNLLESFPPVILAMIGVGQELEIFATNEGFVAIGFFGKSALIFAVYPVVMGMRITANEEDSGTMDVLLSLPIERARVIVEKFLAYGVSCVGVVLLIYLGLHIGVLFGGVELDVLRLAEVTFYLIPLMVFIMAATMLIAVLARRRVVALGIVTAFVIASYMLQTIGLAAEGTVAEPLGVISFLTYYNAGDILAQGFIWPHIAGYVGLSVLLLLASLYRYERRDIGV